MSQTSAADRKTPPFMPPSEVRGAALMLALVPQQLAKGPYEDNASSVIDVHGPEPPVAPPGAFLETAVQARRSERANQPNADVAV